jgi:hypothetical protein
MGFIYALTLLLLGFFSCANTESDNSPVPGAGQQNPPPNGDDQSANTALAGQFDGGPWEVKSAWLTVDNSRKGAHHFFHFSDQTLANPCDGFSGNQKNERKLLCTAETTSGRQSLEFSNKKSLTFVIVKNGTRPENLSGEGWVEVEKADRREAVGKISAKYNESNMVSGSFKAKICPNQFGRPEEDFIEEKEKDPQLLHTFKGVNPFMGGESKNEILLRGDRTGYFKETLFGAVASDIDWAWKIDLGLDHPRIMFETSKINADEDGHLKIGDKKYCIYDREGLSNGKLKFYCSSQRFPAVLPADETLYSYILDRQ